MSKPLKPKRGTTAENDAYIGEAYEVTLDTEKHTLRVHDGVTPGGHELARGGEVGNIREDTVAAAQEAIAHSAGESGSLTLEGVAAEVERKAALDLSNLSAAGRSLAAGLGMPSARYVDLTLGATDTTYTAPGNGYFSIVKRATAANQFLNMYNRTSGNLGLSQTISTSGVIASFILAKKGDSVFITYNANGTLERFRFIYAEGEEA